jgi:hypothetical protein
MACASHGWHGPHYSLTDCSRHGTESYKGAAKVTWVQSLIKKESIVVNNLVTPSYSDPTCLFSLFGHTLTHYVPFNQCHCHLFQGFRIMFE